LGKLNALRHYNSKRKATKVRIQISSPLAFACQNQTRSGPNLLVGAAPRNGCEQQYKDGPSQKGDVHRTLGEGSFLNGNGGSPIFDNRKQLMKVAEVLSLLNISRSHLYKLMKCKGLPYLKVDGATRFEQEAVELWLKKGRRNS
jgi:excisionase family DNA binding protein